MKENQENNTISFHEWLNHLSRLVTLKGTLRSILVTGREQRCRSGWFPRTYSSGGSQIPQVTSRELGSAPSTGPIQSPWSNDITNSAYHKSQLAGRIG